jgi:hypothetical protein
MASGMNAIFERPAVDLDHAISARRESEPPAESTDSDE